MQLGDDITPFAPLNSIENNKSLDEIFDENPLNTGEKSNFQGKIKDAQPHFKPLAEGQISVLEDRSLSPFNDDHAPILNDNGIMRSAEYKGRVIHQGRFDPLELKTDPKTFQYKSGGDNEGVTDRLKSVTKWDDTRSGKTMVWENAQGERFVADGHQRRGLAARLKNNGDDNIGLDGYLFREAEGWAANEVKIIAALKNIGEGSGTVIDAAKIFREAPEANDGSLPLSGTIARDGLDLAKLSDDAFGAIINDVYSVRDGAAVGRIAASNADMHIGMLDILKTGNYSNKFEVELSVRKLLEYHWEKDISQSELFDTKILVPQFFHEKIKVLNLATNALKKHANAFDFIVNKSELFENVGNQLAKNTNEFEAQTANAAAGVMARLADSPGPLQDAVLNAAKKLSDGQKATKEIDEIINIVREVSTNKSVGQILREAQMPPAHELESLANVADNEARFDSIDENLVPIEVPVEKDDLTFDMFGDLNEPKTLIETGEKDLQTISVCKPIGN